jgi:hypothetical protein
VVSREAVTGALRAFDTLGGPRVLDLVADSDLDDAPAATNAPRRMRFRRDGLTVDALVHDTGAGHGLQVLVRLTPPARFVVRAVTRLRELTVASATPGVSDVAGAARLTGLPHGVTSLRVEPADGPPLRTAWVRL